MASLAHDIAMEAPSIRADVIEAMEFPQLAQKYGVSGVPTTVISDVVHFVGSLPEKQFLMQIQEAAEQVKTLKSAGQPPSD